jgi:hypothetical protein
MKNDDNFLYRMAFQVECTWEWNVTNYPTLRKWLLYANVESQNYNAGRACFWPHVHLTVLGLTVGAGVYYEPRQELVDNHWRRR